MKTNILFVLLLCGLAAYAAQLHQFSVNTGSAANDGAGDGLRTAFGKVNTNFTTLWPSRFATNASHALPTNWMIHAWTGVAVRGTNTIPPASHASSSNVVRLVIVDEGGNAGSTNLVYQATSGDRINGATSFNLTNNYQAVRIYTAGGTNWFTW